MKTVKIIVLSIAGLFAFTMIGLFVFLKTFDLNRYLPQITKSASDALRRKVAIDHAGLNISLQGIVLDSSGIRVADVNSGAKFFVEVDKARARLEVMPLLTQRKIEISSITVSGTKVNVPDPKRPLNINIPIMEAKVSNFSLTEPFPIVVDIAFASRQKNIHAATNVQLDLTHAKAVISDLVVHTDLAQLNMNDIRAMTPSLAQAPLPVFTSGTLSVRVPSLTAGAKGVEGLDARVELAEGTFELKEMLKGRINGHMNISGQGLDPEVLLKSLKAQGEVSMGDGMIDTFSILKIALGSVLGVIPGLAESLDNMIAGALRDKLGTDAGVLEKAQAKFTIEDAVVFLDDAVASTKALELNAKGSVGFDMKTDIQVVVLVTENLSADLAKKIEPLGYLRADSQRIKVSGQLTGIIPGVKFIPSVDLKNAGKNAIIEEGSKQLQKIIKKNPVVGDILNSIFK